MERGSPGGGAGTVEATDFTGRAEQGRAARRTASRAAAADWAPASDRPEPVALLEEQAATRVPELVPIRYGRMTASAFAFFRGAALIMAADLASLPVSGLTVQLCGDAHLANFGVFGTPERRLVFDINDFDETLPGPWEWDVARLAASCEVAGRHRGFSAKERRGLALAAVRGYREQMRTSAAARVFDAWYDRLDAERFLAIVEAEHRADHLDAKQVRRAEAGLAKARTRDSIRAASKLVELVDGRLRIMADPPLIVPIEEVRRAAAVRGVDEVADEEELRRLLHEYQATLPLERHPLAEYRYEHMARKVVGVGSVGLRAWVLLLRGRDDDDRLLLQAKQVEASVLERFLPPSGFAHHGERVVRGQRLMQAASDLCLGWQRVVDPDGVARDYALRQLHDWKGSTDLEAMPLDAVRLYARICGETLARAHARSGDRVAIAAYLGSSDRFDRSLAEFAARYAEQNERDHRALLDAVEAGRVQSA